MFRLALAFCTLAFALPVGAITANDLLPVAGKQQLVTIRFSDDVSPYFEWQIGFRSVYELYAYDGSGKTLPDFSDQLLEYGDFDYDFGYIRVNSDGLQYSLPGRILPGQSQFWGRQYNYDWLIRSPKFDGSTLTFWSRIPKWPNQWVRLQSGLYDGKPFYAYGYWSFGAVYSYQEPFVSEGSVVSISRVSAIPEPGLWFLMIAGFGAVGAMHRMAGKGQLRPNG